MAAAAAAASAVMARYQPQRTVGVTLRRGPAGQGALANSDTSPHEQHTRRPGGHLRPPADRPPLARPTTRRHTAATILGTATETGPAAASAEGAAIAAANSSPPCRPPDRRHAPQPGSRARATVSRSRIAGPTPTKHPARRGFQWADQRRIQGDSGANPASASKASLNPSFSSISKLADLSCPTRVPPSR